MLRLLILPDCRHGDKSPPETFVRAFCKGSGEFLFIEECLLQGKKLMYSSSVTLCPICILLFSLLILLYLNVHTIKLLELIGNYIMT